MIFLVAGPYFMEMKGKKRCTQGSRNVKNAAECATACAMLNISSSIGWNVSTSDGQSCYKDGNVCNQNVTAGKEASLICKNRRKKYEMISKKGL